MGYTNWAVRKAQQGLCERAADAAWVAACGVGMVIGPVTLAMKERGDGLPAHELDSVLKEFVKMWNDVCHLSDRNLGRNRNEYIVHPNPPLSDLLVWYESVLRMAQNNQLPVQERVELLRKGNSDLTLAVQEYLRWLAEQCRLIEFDYGRYEDKAVNVGQKYWGPTVRELSRAWG